MPPRATPHGGAVSTAIAIANRSFWIVMSRAPVALPRGIDVGPIEMDTSALAACGSKGTTNNKATIRTRQQLRRKEEVLTNIGNMGS